MEIDLWTLIAQIINLFILLFLLRKFLYIPVLKAVDARRELIRGELQKAEDEYEKAKMLSNQCSHKLAQIERDKQQILLQAQEKAEKIEQQLIAQANEAYEIAQKEWRHKLQRQKGSFQHTMQEVMVECFNKMATSALFQIADADVNELAVRKFIHKIATLDNSQKKNIVSQFRSSEKIEVQSAHELSEENKLNLKKTMQGEFSVADSTVFEFKQNSDLICGIIVQAKDYMISWNLKEYVEEFKSQADKAIQKIISRG